MINLELARIFAQMAQILEFLGDPKDKFKIRALSNVSIALGDVNEDLMKMAAEKRLREIHGVGEGIAAKIEEYIKTGKVGEFELLKKTIPSGFFEMLSIPSLGPKKVKSLNSALNIKTVAELKKAIEEGKVQTLPGFGEKSAKNILEGMKIKSATRRPIGDVFLHVQAVIDVLEKCPQVAKAVPAGSFRRFEETVGDIDILATGKDPKKIISYFTKQSFIKKILVEGETKTSILTGDGLQIDLRVVSPEQFGSALQYFTGSKLHNVHLRTFAKNRGYKLSEYGFFKGEKLVASKTEEDCYSSLGMQYIPPELRTDTGEIEAAFKHELPELLELHDIKGDLHAHSLWSDGKNSIAEMAGRAHEFGYEYIAITDHSPHLTVARGLSVEKLKEKKREIEKLNEKSPIKILFGTEVDILDGGKMDYPDEILKLFDVVVASIHSKFNRDNTDRLLAAMQNPFVHIIGHPSGRLIGQRNPYSLDYLKLFKCASETGTVIEINAHYMRLDLQDIYIREAKRWKCRFSIGSDAHSVGGLSLMEIGVRWARRGWTIREDIINTLPLKNLKKALK